MCKLGVPEHKIKPINSLTGKLITHEGQRAFVRSKTKNKTKQNKNKTKQKNTAGGGGFVQHMSGCQTTIKTTLFNLYAEYIVRSALADWDRGMSLCGFGRIKQAEVCR